MQCPYCKTPLRELDLEDYLDLSVDHCDTCNGAWFAAGDRDRVDDSIWVDVEDLAFKHAAGDQPSRRCPRCAVRLEALSPPSNHELILDRCPRCMGFWLDSSEVKQVLKLALKLASEPVGKASSQAQQRAFRRQIATYHLRGFFR